MWKTSWATLDAISGGDVYSELCISEYTFEARTPSRHTVQLEYKKRPVAMCDFFECVAQLALHRVSPLLSTHEQDATLNLD